MEGEMKKYLVMAVLVVGGCAPMSQVQKRDVEISGLKEQLRLTEQEKDLSKESLKKQIDALQAENKNITQQNDALQEKIQTLNRDIETLNIARVEDVSKVKSTYDSFVAGLKDEVNQGQIEIKQLKDRISVNMVDKILFNSGESDINEQGKKTLLKVGNILKTAVDRRIVVEGHTDNVKISPNLKDKFPTNWELSSARAINVVHYLQDLVGIDPKILSAAAFGQYKWIADNTKPEGRSKNRRIEIILLPLEKPGE
jgi:chemotaxis protein MotB